MKNFLLLLVGVTLSLTVAAQRNGGGNRHFDPEQMRAEALKESVQKRAEKLASDMKLSDQDKEWFVGLYTEMQDTLFQMKQAQFSVGEKKEKEYTDEEYTQLTEDSFRQQIQEVQTRHNYYLIMSERLTPAQLYRVFMRDQGQRQMRQAGQNGGGRQGGGFPGGPGGPGGPF